MGNQYPYHHVEWKISILTMVFFLFYRIMPFAQDIVPYLTDLIEIHITAGGRTDMEQKPNIVPAGKDIHCRVSKWNKVITQQRILKQHGSIMHVY